MTSDVKTSNWPLMTVYIIVLVVGFMMSAFLVAFYWKVGDIRRVDPMTVNYQVDPQEISQNSIFPLSDEVIESAIRDQGGDFRTPADATSITEPDPTATKTVEASAPTSELPTPTPSLVASPTSSRTPTRTPSPTFTPTGSSLTTTQSVPTLTRTPRPTSVNPSNTPNNPAPTNTSLPQPTNTVKPPTATQAPPPTATTAPRPTQPPPTATKDSYPPPRPTDPPPTAYP